MSTDARRAGLPPPPTPHPPHSILLQLPSLMVGVCVGFLRKYVPLKKGKRGPSARLPGTYLPRARCLCCLIPSRKTIQNRKLIQAQVSCVDRMLGSRSGGRGVRVSPWDQRDRGLVEPWRLAALREVGESVLVFVGTVIGGRLTAMTGHRAE